jgi:hypothetical protein
MLSRDAVCAKTVPAVSKKIAAKNVSFSLCFISIGPSDVFAVSEVSGFRRNGLNVNTLSLA